MSRTLLAQLGQAAQVQTASPFTEAVMLMGVGMLVVFTALVLLLLAIVLINRFGGEAPTDQAASSDTSATRTDELNPQTLAVLAAAATVALQRPARILSARRVDSNDR